MTSVHNYPDQYETWMTLKNEKEIFIRPILPTDGKLVIDFFQKLSPESLYLRFLNQLRALPEDLLHRFIHIDYSNEFALVGLIKEDGKDSIVAISRYAYTKHFNITDLAVAVRDDWQNLGIGKALLKKVVDIGKENNIFRFKGMIHPQNKIIIRILLELGYEVKYHLKGGFFQLDILV